jgi:putative ABC transport system substrate-binding protein
MLAKKQTHFSILLFCAASLIFCACQRPAKVYHVGILSGFSYFADTADGFKTQMAALGYIEGENITYDQKNVSVADVAAYRSVIDGFVKNKVDLVFVFPSEASMIAKELANAGGIPVVFAIANIEGTGLVKSVREPGENITGVRWPGPDLCVERFEMMLNIVPRLKRVFVAYQEDYPIVPAQLQALRQAVLQAGVALVEIPARDLQGLKSALKKQDTVIKPGPDVFISMVDPFSVDPAVQNVITEFTARHQIPIGGTMLAGRDGASIFSLIPDSKPMGTQAAILADKVLKGVPAGTIPVVTAQSQLRINYKAARALGIQIDDGILSRALEVYR